MNHIERTILIDTIVKSYTEIFAFSSEAIMEIRVKLENLGQKELEKECHALDDYYANVSRAYLDGHKSVMSLSEQIETTQEQKELEHLSFIDA